MTRLATLATFCLLASAMACSNSKTQDKPTKPRLPVKGDTEPAAGNATKLPPMDKRCTTDADCIAIWSIYDTPEGSCCHGCNTNSVAKRWWTKATKVCQSMTSRGCPTKKCAALLPAKCLNRTCTVELKCGSATCKLGEFCEDRFKGHAADDKGRPLNRKSCMPLPKQCLITPTCGCVTKHVNATYCSDDGGRVRLNDYPKR